MSSSLARLSEIERYFCLGCSFLDGKLHDDLTWGKSTGIVVCVCLRADSKSWFHPTWLKWPTKTYLSGSGFEEQCKWSRVPASPRRPVTDAGFVRSRHYCSKTFIRKPSMLADTAREELGRVDWDIDSVGPMWFHPPERKFLDADHVRHQQRIFCPPRCRPNEF